MLGPVSAWVGDRLWTGKPHRCGTRHPGLFSLSLLMLEWVPGISWGSKQAYGNICLVTPTRIHGLSVFAECLAVGLACGVQCWLMGSGSTLEALRDDALYKSTYFTVTFNGSHNMWPSLQFECQLAKKAVASGAFWPQAPSVALLWTQLRNFRSSDPWWSCTISENNPTSTVVHHRQFHWHVNS